MCNHVDCAAIEEQVLEERWEGDDLTCDVYGWVVCRDCGVDFACTPQ